MKIRSRIWLSIVVSLVVSGVLAFFAISAVRGIGEGIARENYYGKIIQKAFALNLLVATYEEESGPRALQQLREVRASLTSLLDGLSSSDAGEESLIIQLRRNNREIGPLLDQFLAGTTGYARLQPELKSMLSTQLGSKVRFISDDTYRLMVISESRMVSGYTRAGVTVLILLIALIAANFVIAWISGRSIVRMEADLQEQREWLQVTLSSIGDAVIATDTECRVSFLNPVASALTGWSIVEAMGRPVQSLFRIINEKTGAPAEDVVARVLREGMSIGLANHTALVARDGREIPIEDSAAPIKDRSGKVAGVVLVFHDVTEKRRAVEGLRESEEKFRSGFAHAAIGFTMMRPDGRFVDANPAYCLLTGYSVAELQTLNFQQLVHSEDLAEYIGRIDRMLAGDFSSFVVENRYLPRGGKPLWVRKSVSLVRDSAGAPEWILVLIENINDRKKAEEALQKVHAQLQEHARRLEETNKELESFAYTISHDLRAPLRAINGFARMLTDDFGQSMGEEAKRRLSVIETNAVKMGNLIDDLLAYSRVSRTKLNVSRIDMNDLVEEVVDGLKKSYAGTDPPISVAELPSARGDRTLIRQVVMNLLENALKFSRYRTEPRIELGSLTKDGERVYFVKDNGVGFDMKYHGKLFGVFQRLVTDREFEGTGVGLAIVQRLVSRHGGKVWAESRPGEGATFFFTLKPEYGGHL